MVKTIEAEGVTFMYVGGIDWREGVSLARHHFPALDVAFAAEVLQRPDVRLALFEERLPFAPHGWMPQLLAWASLRDLTQLDSRVGQGTHSDADFVDSIKAEPQRHLTRCRSCDASHPSLLVDAGNPYPHARGLLQQKIPMFLGKRCSNCGQHLTEVLALLL